MSPRLPRPDQRGALLDGTERLLIAVGREGVTTRRVAREAGVNHGLVHYYFGSVENLLLAVCDRVGTRLVARHSAIYASGGPFIERWRGAMAAIDAGLADGDLRIWWELQAIAFAQPRMRARVARVNRRWRAVLHAAFEDACAEYRLSRALVAPMATLVMTFAGGLAAERLVGIADGHAELLAWFDGLLAGLAESGPP